MKNAEGANWFMRGQLLQLTARDTPQPESSEIQQMQQPRCLA